MEIRRMLKGSSKGQLMTIVVLVFVMLMITSLIAFVAINLGYDSISQSSQISTSNSNLAASLQKSASSFAYSSGQAAMVALYKYEANASLRKSNFISNLSTYLQYLIVNGTLPNVNSGSRAANTLAYYMSNSTLKSYNAFVSTQSAFGQRTISIIESKPLVSQQSPYSITIAYTEYVNVDTSSGTYAYTIPVNVSIPISNYPDLFYAQQGIYRQVSFGSISKLVSNIGNEYAGAGNASAFVYGTAYFVPSPTSCTSLGLPSSISSPPYSSQIVIVTPNAMAITSGGCALLNSFGGLITDNITNAPSIPYLVYSTTNNALQYMQTGQKILLYGPGMATLNISGLLNAVNYQQYFTSQFAPSYSDRAAGNLQVQSPFGITTFSTYGKEAAVFNGLALSSITSAQPQGNVVSYTIAAWVYPQSQNGLIFSGTGSGHSLMLGVGNVLTCGGTPGTFFMADNGVGVTIGVNSIAQFPMNNWYFIAGTFNSMSGSAVLPSGFTLYVNGVKTATGTLCNTGADSSPIASESGTQFGLRGFNGLISNVQIYNNSLTAYQIQHLYQEGIEALPISNSPLSGWYTLNGNTNDYSGNGYVTSTNVVYFSLLPGYTRDSLLPSNVSQTTYPIPGIGVCNNYAQCSALYNPDLYIGNSQFQVGAGTTAAYFNGQTSYVEQGAGFNSLAASPTPAYSVSVWVYPMSGNGVIVDELGQRDQGVNWHNAIITLGASSIGTGGNVWMEAWGLPCTSIGTVPLDQWSNIVMTYTPATGFSGYINGVRGGGATGTRSPAVGFALGMYYPIGNGDATTCGYNPALSSLPFTGMMSDYQFYGTQLTGGQISTIYSEGIEGLPLSGAGLMQWYPLNGNSNDYTGFSSASVSNQISYTYLQYNDSGFNSQNSLIAAGIGTVSGEWQALGFGYKTLPQTVWNVSSWNLTAATQSIPYADVTSNPASPATVVPNQTGSWYSGITGSSQSWAYSTAAYAGTSLIGAMQQSPFPQSLYHLQSSTSCSSPYNTTGYTATANMTLSGTYRIQIATAGYMEVAYRPVGGAWSYVFGGAAWVSQKPTIYGPAYITLTPGTYQFAVDWMNTCGAGLSDFMMTR